MTTALWVLFGFLSNVNISGAKFEEQCFYIFQRYSSFSILPFKLLLSWSHHFPNLHNTKTLISLKRKKIFQKRKTPFLFFFWKAFQIISNYCSFHRNFKLWKGKRCVSIDLTFYMSTYPLVKEKVKRNSTSNAL